ncbi:MAG: YkgJ family cysteine cluster protein [Fibrobacteria bacterium]|nr:YkgJ family cysteine cluster protein [Fibrobacteria bacterium]
MTTEDTKKMLRMEVDQIFQFNCAPGVSCFTKCCQDVTIVLTPYDVIRMKNALGISSEEFIDKYTVIVPKKDKLIPMVVLKMDEESKKCTLVSDKGCGIYADRPWPCRMYPLNLNDDGTYGMIAERSKCKGLDEDAKMKINDWLIGQGVLVYEEMNELFAEITIPLSAQNLDIDNPQIHQMVFMALYNQDKFKDFVFKSSFLKKFVIEDEIIEKIKDDDIELMKFAFDWIKFGILGQKTMWIKAGADGK